MHDGVAVRRRARDRIGADDAAGAGRFSATTGWPMSFAELLREHAADVVDDPAGRVGQDEADRLARIGLRLPTGEPRRRRTRRGRRKSEPKPYPQRSVYVHSSNTGGLELTRGL